MLPRATQPVNQRGTKGWYCLRRPAASAPRNGPLRQPSRLGQTGAATLCPTATSTRAAPPSARAAVHAVGRLVDVSEQSRPGDLRGQRCCRWALRCRPRGPADHGLGPAQHQTSAAIRAATSPAPTAARDMPPAPRSTSPASSWGWAPGDGQGRLVRVAATASASSCAWSQSACKRFATVLSPTTPAHHDHLYVRA
jgi:hypothetical protein